MLPNWNLNFEAWWPWKMVKYSFYQRMDEKIKTWTLCFPAKENPNIEKALFDWPIMLQYDTKVKYQLISRKFLGMKIFHQSEPKATCVCIRSKNQSNHSISVRFLLLFCSGIFISRSFENCSILTRLWDKFNPHDRAFRLACQEALWGALAVSGGVLQSGCGAIHLLF